MFDFPQSPIQSAWHSGLGKHPTRSFLFQDPHPCRSLIPGPLSLRRMLGALTERIGAWLGKVAGTDSPKLSGRPSGCLEGKSAPSCC